jgi:hypothetical protein
VQRNNASGALDNVLVIALADGRVSPVLVAGSERPRQLTLGWWDRFQVADGVIATVARFVVAAAIIGCVLWAGRLVGSGTVFAINGLAHPVVVELGSSSQQIRPYGYAELAISPGDYTLRATTSDGEVIEELAVGVERPRVHYVYNIAGAAEITEWYLHDGRGLRLAPPHWQETAADYVFSTANAARAPHREDMVLIYGP